MKKRILAKTSWFCSKNLIIIHLIVFLFALLLFLPGCSPFIETSSPKIDVGDSSTNVSTGNNEEITQTSNSNESTTSTESNSSSETTTETTEAGLTIKVYYANADVSALVGEERIVGSSHRYLEAFLELMKPPINPGLVRLEIGRAHV